MSFITHTHARTHTHTHTRTHTRTHAHTHTRTRAHTRSGALSLEGTRDRDKGAFVDDVIV